MLCFEFIGPQDWMAMLLRVALPNSLLPSSAYPRSEWMN